MALGSSDRSEFVAAVSALLYMQHAGLVIAVNGEARLVAERAVTAAEALWTVLQERGHVEPEQP